MKVTYTADDGTEFNSAYDCFAYEEATSKQAKRWLDLFEEDKWDKTGLYSFVMDLQIPLIEFEHDEDLWIHRRKFVLLAKSFIEIDPTLKDLL